MPDTFTRNNDNSEPDAKEEQIATLQAENARLLQDKELLMRAMREGK